MQNPIPSSHHLPPLTPSGQTLEQEDVQTPLKSGTHLAVLPSSEDHQRLLNAAHLAQKRFLLHQGTNIQPSVVENVLTFEKLDAHNVGNRVSQIESDSKHCINNIGIGSRCKDPDLRKEDLRKEVEALQSKIKADVEEARKFLLQVYSASDGTILKLHLKCALLHETSAKMNLTLLQQIEDNLPGATYPPKNPKPDSVSTLEKAKRDYQVAAKNVNIAVQEMNSHLSEITPAEEKEEKQTHVPPTANNLTHGSNNDQGQEELENVDLNSVTESDPPNESDFRNIPSDYGDPNPPEHIS